MTWPVIIGILILLSALDLLAIALWYTCSWPQSQVLGPALIRGPSGDPRVALTFDDGPLPPFTEQILDILRERKIRATFFICGRNARQYPEIVRRIHSEGHAIGNHTWSHPYLYLLSRRKMAEEIDRTQDAIRQATGQEPVFFRPPYGARWFGLYGVLRERKMQLIQWSVTGYDWRLGAEGILAAVRTGMLPGAIILLHDGCQVPGGYLQRLFRKCAPAIQTKPGKAASLQSGRWETVKALPEIIDCARAAGLDLVSVDEFLPARSTTDKPSPAK